MQNRKLSERLRERNHKQNRLQHQLEEEQQRSTRYGEILGAVESHLSELRDLVQAHTGQLGGSVWGNESHNCSSLSGVDGDEGTLPLVKGLIGLSGNESFHQLDVFFTSVSTAVRRHGDQTLSQLKEALEQVCVGIQLC